MSIVILASSFYQCRAASSLTDHHHEQVPCDMVLAHDDDLALARHPPGLLAYLCATLEAQSVFPISIFLNEIFEKADSVQIQLSLFVLPRSKAWQRRGVLILMRPTPTCTLITADGH
jgi:hypothetical protein